MGSSHRNKFFNSKKLLYCFYIIILIIFDQSSKKFVVDYLASNTYQEYKISSFFSIVHLWNYGISFGMFKSYAEYSNIIFLLVNSFIILYLINLLFKERSNLPNLALILIIGGAVGNIIDRIYYGAVFDFISITIGDFSAPVFNFADSFISIGGFVILINLFSIKNQNRHES